MGARSIELDACPSCRLLWFDAGEVEKLEADATRLRPTQELDGGESWSSFLIGELLLGILEAALWD